MIRLHTERGMALISLALNERNKKGQLHGPMYMGYRTGKTILSHQKSVLSSLSGVGDAGEPPCSDAVTQRRVVCEHVSCRAVRMCAHFCVGRQRVSPSLKSPCRQHSGGSIRSE